MHQDPEHEDYDDDQYNYYPSYDNYKNNKKYKIDWAAWEYWLSGVIKDIVKEDNQKSKLFLYLGSNNFSEGIWKRKYFVSDKLNQEYKNHMHYNASHVLMQPAYYKSLFEILN